MHMHDLCEPVSSDTLIGASFPNHALWNTNPPPLQAAPASNAAHCIPVFLNIHTSLIFNS